MMLKYFFGGMSVDDFNILCNDFSKEVLPSLIRSKAMNEIIKLKEIGAEVVIVSASPENWLLQWCNKVGVKCIATKLVITKNKITGKIEGLNCHGDEKVRRIKESYHLPSYASVYCYGDTPGDRPMLALANITFYKPFR